MNRADRAKQFMPFAALRGYEDLIRKKQRIICPKKELSEGEAARLTEIVSSLKKGDIVEARFYDNDGYTEVAGAVTEIDFTLKTLRVIKTKIYFDDLADIKSL